MPPTDSNDSALLAAFIAAFDIPKSQRGDPDSWRPVAVTTEPRELARLYRLLPGPFPPLYEQIMIFERLREVEVVADSFRDMVQETVKQGREIQGEP